MLGSRDLLTCHEPQAGESRAVEHIAELHPSQAAAAAGISFSELLDRLIELALEEE